MQILLVNRKRGQARSINLGLGLVAGIAVAVLLSAVVISYQAGAARAPQAAVSPEIPGMLANLRVELDDQRAELVSSREQLKGVQTGMARHFGRMQAQLMRLNAAAKRLTESAKIDPAEFDFDDEPPLGGPHTPADAIGAPSLAALAELEAELEFKQRQYHILEHLLMIHQLYDDHRPAGWPVRSGWISSIFGLRTDPMSGSRSRHQGIDFAARSGSRVEAVAAGTVIYSGHRAGYGNLIELDHGNGYVTRYAHNKRNLVKLGEQVMRGQAIAQVGSTGRSTGPHVHFEVLVNGINVDPMSFVGDAG